MNYDSLTKKTAKGIKIILRIKQKEVINILVETKNSKKFIFNYNKLNNQKMFCDEKIWNRYHYWN